jgi:hypothetical protein
LVTAFLAGAFRAVAFVAPVFFTGAFFTTFLAADPEPAARFVDDLVAAFFAETFEAAVFTADAFLATPFLAGACLAAAARVTAFFAGVLAAGATVRPPAVFLAGGALTCDFLDIFGTDFLAGEALAVRRARLFAAATARRTAPPVLLTRTAIVWPSRLGKDQDLTSRPAATKVSSDCGRIGRR